MSGSESGAPSPKREPQVVPTPPSEAVATASPLRLPPLVEKAGIAADKIAEIVFAKVGFTAFSPLENSWESSKYPITELRKLEKAYDGKGQRLSQDFEDFVISRWQSTPGFKNIVKNSKETSRSITASLRTGALFQGSTYKIEMDYAGKKKYFARSAFDRVPDAFSIVTNIGLFVAYCRVENFRPLHIGQEAREALWHGFDDRTRFKVRSGYPCPLHMNFYILAVRELKADSGQSLKILNDERDIFLAFDPMDRTADDVARLVMHESGGVVGALARVTDAKALAVTCRSEISAIMDDLEPIVSKVIQAGSWAAITCRDEIRNARGLIVILQKHLVLQEQLGVKGRTVDQLRRSAQDSRVYISQEDYLLSYLEKDTDLPTAAIGLLDHYKVEISTSHSLSSSFIIGVISSLITLLAVLVGAWLTGAV